MKVCIFIVLIIILTQYFVSLQLLCSQQDQICVPIDHCSSVNKRMYEQNLNESETKYLNSLQCDFINEKVYVCCNSSLPKPIIGGQCGLLPLGFRISGGNQTKLGDYPWTVLLSRRWKNRDNSTGLKDHCGGSLINHRYVLTAAHCVLFLDNSFRRRLIAIEIVKLGEWDRSTNPDKQNDFTANRIVEAIVESIIPHNLYLQHYKSNKQHDIALLRLKEKVEFSKFIKPICLPRKEEEYSLELTVIGWGKMKSSQDGLEEIQRHAIVNFVDNAKCNEIYKGAITSTQLCAGSEKSDSCFGDSGGPLVGASNEIIYPHLAGVVSFGQKECGIKGVPGVYTDVRKYIDWIEQTIIH